MQNNNGFVDGGAEGLAVFTVYGDRGVKNG